jgi:hypothetical protein
LLAPFLLVFSIVIVLAGKPNIFYIGIRSGCPIH